MTELEGVTKFEASHSDAELAARVYGEPLAQLIAWRQLLASANLVGRDEARYGGAAYGNISARVGAPSSPLGRRAMIISGTQTGGRGFLTAADFCVVSVYDIARNRVESRGPTAPSSEAMTHGAVYDCSPSVRAVLHGHSPLVWNAAKTLRMPITDAGIAYGTPAMAREVARLYRQTRLPESRLFAMGGHEDGIVAFGSSVRDAAVTLLTAVADAYRLGGGEGD